MTSQSWPRAVVCSATQICKAAHSASTEPSRGGGTQGPVLGCGHALTGPGAPWIRLPAAAALLLIGIGAGFAFRRHLRPDRLQRAQQAGAAAAVSETACELDVALGIALLGSIVTAVYPSFTPPPGTPPAATEHARTSISTAADAASASAMFQDTSYCWPPKQAIAPSGRLTAIPSRLAGS